MRPLAAEYRPRIDFDRLEIELLDHPFDGECDCFCIDDRHVDRQVFPISRVDTSAEYANDFTRPKKNRSNEITLLNVAADACKQTRESCERSSSPSVPKCLLSSLSNRIGPVDRGN